MQINTPDTPHLAYDGVRAVGPSDVGALTPLTPSTSESPDTTLSAVLRSALEGRGFGSTAEEAAAERVRLAALYKTVVSRVAVLRDEGHRPERVLVLLKRETFAVMDAMALAGTPADGRRADEVMRHIIRWSVQAYHRGD